jgi:regulatory protein
MRKLNGKITAISAGSNPRIQRSNIYLDGKFAFSLDNEVLMKEHLRVGSELARPDILKLTMADHFQRCLNAAYQFLAYRPRSEAEIRQRLQRRGFEIEDIERSISELKRQDLVNDATFAEFWRDNRTSFRPRGQRMVRQELRQKGVETAVINETVEDMDDRENAYKAAMAKARGLPLTDYTVFRQRLGSYLQRRGFNYGVINNIVKQAWQESLSGHPATQDTSAEADDPE